MQTASEEDYITLERLTGLIKQIMIPKVTTFSDDVALGYGTNHVHGIKALQEHVPSTASNLIF